MCRLFGYFDAHLTGHQLRTVSLLQQHGGPDAQSHRRDRGWALGSNRLAIMGIDGGAQPYTALDGRIVVVFNGEIYNHRELRARLATRGHAIADSCDGSVLPAMYLEYGTTFPEQLDGMYAVAVMDLRGEPSLILATDDMGMKTVYYHWDPPSGRFAFASEIPALLAFPGVDAARWVPGLDEYLTTKVIFGERTAFESINVLPPAATMVLNRRLGLQVRRRPSPAAGIADVGSEAAVGDEPAVGGASTFGRAAEAVRATLRAEVRRLLLADVPISSITSGGLDSSLVSSMAAEAVDLLHTFNIAYRGDWPSDERAFAAEVAQRCGTTHHQVLADPASFPDLLGRVVWHLGQPNSDPITLSTSVLFQQVHAAGFKVALTGDAADELFGGYDRVKAAVAAPAGSAWIDRYAESLAAVPSGLRRTLYTADYRDFIDRRGSARERIVDELRAGGSDRLRVLTEFEIGQRLPAYHLRRVDHLSMAHAVEARLPYCQRAVVRLARSLPDEAKVRDGQGKRVLTAAAGPYLPDSVLNRPKQPFTLPVTAMLGDGEPLMAFARDVLAPANVAATGQLDPAAVQRLLREQSSRPTDRAATAIWALLIYLLWVDEFAAPAHVPQAALTEVIR